jgi:hypothetical protein
MLRRHNMLKNSRAIRFGALVALLLLVSCALLAGPAEANNPVSSRWVKNLSGGEPPGERWFDRSCEVAVSGNYVHVLWYSTIQSTAEKVYYCRSVDGGQTFEEKVALYAEPCPIPNRLAFHTEEKHLEVDGATVHVAFFQTDPTRQVLYFRSDDNGASFTPQTFTEVDGVNDSTYISAHQGKVSFTVLRSWYAWKSIVVYTSTDDGQTWENHVAFSGTQDGIGIKDIQRYGDHVHLLFRRYFYAAGDNWSANCISSLDDGATFPPQQVLTTPTPEGRYLTHRLQDANYVPHLAVEGDNVLVVWGQSDRLDWPLSGGPCTTGAPRIRGSRSATPSCWSATGRMASAICSLVVKPW